MVDSEVVKNTKFNTIKTKVNNLEKKFLMQLIHINQCNTEQTKFREKVRHVDKKIPDPIGLVATTVLNTKISETESI